MGEKCVVCGEPQTHGTVNYCSDCKLPCTTKCASRKKNAPCDLCRAAKQAKKQKVSSLNESKRATATISTRSSAHRTPGSSGNTSAGRKSASTSTVKKTRAGASSSPSLALSLRTLSTEKGKRRQPLLNSPLGETLSTTRKTPSVKGATEKRTPHSGAVWKKKFQKYCLKPIFNEKQIFKRILRVLDL